MRLPYERCKLLYDELGLHFWPPQEAFIRDRTAPFIFFSGGAGAGKSMSGARYILPELFVPNRIFWYIGPTFDQTHTEFDWTVMYLEQLRVEYQEPPTRPREGEWSFRLKGGTKVVTKSGARPDGLHSEPVDGVLCCEAGQLDEWLVLNRILPRVGRARSEDAGFVLFCGTFEGANTWMSEKFDIAVSGLDPDWHAYHMASWENLDDFPGGRDDPKIKLMERQMPRDEFEQRFGGIPKAPGGVVFKEFSMENHVKLEPDFDMEKPVYITVDPGRYYSVCACQIVPWGVRVLDEVYLLDGTNERAIEECVKRPWWDRVVGGWIDVHATDAHAVWSGGAVWKVLSERFERSLHGVSLRSIEVEVMPGTDRFRTFLHDRNFIESEAGQTFEYQGVRGIARVTFHPRCTNSISEMGRYSFPRDPRAYGIKPIDRNNHSIKGLTYLIVGQFGLNATWHHQAQPVPRRTVYGVLR